MSSTYYKVQTLEELLLLNPIILNNNNNEKAQICINNAYCTSFRSSVTLS